MRQLILAAALAALAVPAIAAETSNKPAKATGDKAAAKANKTAAPAQPAQVAINVALADYTAFFLKGFDDLDRFLNTPQPVPAPAPAANDKKDGKPAEPPAPQLPKLSAEQLADVRWKIYRETSPYALGSDETTSRQAFQEAWPRLEKMLPELRTSAGSVQRKLSEVNNALASAVALEKPIDIRYVMFVGTFTQPYRSDWENNRMSFYIPVEQGVAPILPAFSRTMARYILGRTAVWGEHPRNLAELVVQEGVVAHLIADQVPGQSQAASMDLSDAQLQAAVAQRKDNLKDLIGRLAEPAPANPTPEQLAKLRHAGWLLVDSFHKQDLRSADLIRQKPADLVKTSQLLVGNLIRAK